MTVWQLREAVESRVPAWALFVPVVGGVIAWLFSRRD